MNNNEPDTLPDPAIGYIFQNDIVALKQAFSLPDIDYADISQREQLAAALKRWPYWDCRGCGEAWGQQPSPPH
ncbi:TPA: hypothetical protein JTO38_003547 [Escherichia coli]|nr:hypothetical protein [Escherichia coli]